MLQIKCVTCSVDYGDYLALTLPRNAKHFTEVVVATSPEDRETQEVVGKIPNARCLVTDVWHRHGASFNKGAGLNEAFQELGLDGWLAVLDADTLLPADFCPGDMDKDCLHSARRRMLQDGRRFSDKLDWETCPITEDWVLPGYFHLFHGSDVHLPQPPWFDPTYKHAGGADGQFQSLWEKNRKKRFGWDVLHIGPRDQNWHGRCTPRLDGKIVKDAVVRRRQQQTFRNANGGVKAIKHNSQENRTASCIWLDPTYQEHIQFPGHEPRPWKFGVEL